MKIITTRKEAFQIIRALDAMIQDWESMSWTTGHLRAIRDKVNKATIPVARKTKKRKEANNG